MYLLFIVFIVYFVNMISVWIEAHRKLKICTFYIKIVIESKRKLICRFISSFHIILHVLARLLAQILKLKAKQTNKNLRNYYIFKSILEIRLL